MQMLANDFLSFEDNLVVFNDFTVAHYLHGRCHLFALVASKVLGLPMQWLWDLDPVYDDAPEEAEPRAALGHVWLTRKNNEVVDAKGISNYDSIVQKYEPLCWVPNIEPTNAIRIIECMQYNMLDDFLPGEEEAIESFIVSNKSYYTLCCDDIISENGGFALSLAVNMDPEAVNN